MRIEDIKVNPNVEVRNVRMVGVKLDPELGFERIPQTCFHKRLGVEQSDIYIDRPLVDPSYTALFIVSFYVAYRNVPGLDKWHAPLYAETANGLLSVRIDILTDGDQYVLGQCLNDNVFSPMLLDVAEKIELPDIRKALEEYELEQ